MTAVVITPDDLNPALAGLDAEIDALKVRVEALESIPPPEPMLSPAVEAPWVGAYVGAQSGTVNYQQVWNEAQRGFGPLHVWRCFDSSIKSDPGLCRYNSVKGPIPFYSLKPTNSDITGFVNGTYTVAYQAVVNGLPPGSHLAVWHEPEDDMPGSTFYDLTRKAYDDCKAVRPDITFCYASMAHQWGVTSGNTGTVSGWLDAAKYVDMVTTDVYAPYWDFNPMETDSGFARWFDEIVLKAGRPWGVSERGISSTPGETGKADILAADWSFLCRNGGDMFLYWNATWDNEPYGLTVVDTKALMRGIASQGRCR